MRLNAHNGIRVAVDVKGEPTHIQIQLGGLRYSCTPEEAAMLARELTDAVEEARQRTKSNQLGTRVFDWPDA